jgi:hypothetical protein
MNDQNATKEIDSLPCPEFDLAHLVQLELWWLKTLIVGI